MISLDLERIKEKVIEVYKECDIHTFPIDCFAILEHYGMRTITYCDVKQNNPELYLAISSYSKDAFRFRMSVYYNSCNTDRRIRFSLMHELGHYILGHEEETQENEDEADCFASHMIAPRIAIEEFGCTTADELHERFKLSYAASNRTLMDYNKWKNTKHSKSDNRLYMWIFHKERFLKTEARIKSIQKERRKLQRQIKLYEERTQFILEYCPEYYEKILEYQRLGNM